jgi:replication factor C subunit 2/4
MAAVATQLPWVEKYRPKSVDEVSHQGEVVASLKKSLEQKNLPHLIFYGPPGTGKTSTILACARQLYGAEYKNRVMELNASDERGIAVVRNKIKSFAQVAVSSNDNLPPYKLIVLDEADSMTTDAQSALRRTMETYSKVTRFCIICNYISRLIPPIASRCAKFRFKPLPGEAMIDRLQFIGKQEGVDCSDEAMGELIKYSEGDMRRAIQMLQSLHRLHGGGLQPQGVLDLCGAVPHERMSALFDVCRANDWERLAGFASDMLADGYPVAQIVTQMLEFIVRPEEPFTNVARAKIATQLGEVDKQLIDGACDSLQLMNLLAYTSRMIKPGAP